MALGSVAISGGMSKKTKERLMYMDGKLVWSAAMGDSSGTSAKAPDTVDYLVVKPVARSYMPGQYNGLTSPGATEVRVARGCSAAITASQHDGSSSSYRELVSYATVTFASDGTIRVSYCYSSLNGCISVEGYQYL